MYNNHNSTVKHETRLELFESVKKVVKKQRKVKALTLPSSNFIFEDMIISEFPGKYEIDCVERDNKCFSELSKKVIGKANIWHFNMDVFDFLSNTDEKYNFIWLDLCGPMSRSNIQGIVQLIGSDRLMKDTYLYFTLLAARETDSKELEDFYKTDINTIRTVVFPNILREMVIDTGRKCKMLPIIHYKSELNKKSSPMNVYGFHIN